MKTQNKYFAIVCGYETRDLTVEDEVELQMKNAEILLE
jgi:hypothetical protein